MSDLIESIKSNHEALTLRQQEVDDPFDSVTEIRDFIQQIRAAGKDTPPGPERELLRSLVQYWASVYFDASDTGVFPKTELEPFTGEIPPEPTAEPDATSFLPHLIERYERQLRYIAVGIGVLVVIFLVGVVSQFFIPEPITSTPLPSLEQTATASYFNLQWTVVAATQLALGEETTRIVAESTQTAVSNVSTQQAATDTPTAEPTATPTPTAMPTPTLAPEDVRVELTSLKDQDSVSPRTTLKGTYTNLEPGWSIHVIIQNIAQEDAPFFPSSEFFTIPAGSTDGEWEIDVQFGREEEWAISSPYRISYRIATTDSDREILSDAVVDGIADLAGLPPTIKIPTNLVTTTVVRNAFENRIVYSLEARDGVDLFSSSLEGGETIQLTGPNSIAEFYPALSSDGLFVVFVGAKSNHPDYHYSIWIMDSTGQNQGEIEKTQTFNPIERPSWQPGGNLIVYNEQNLETRVWKVKLLNLDDQEIREISPEGRNFQNPVWMPDGKSIIASARQIISTASEKTLLTLGLHKIDVESGEVTEIYTNSEIEISQPALSPDGRLIAFVAYPSNNPESAQGLYVLEIDPETGLPIDSETGPILLTTRGYLTLPSWDPSGQTIYFQTFERDASSGAIVGMIFAIERDGTNIRRVDTPIRVYEGPAIGLIEVIPAP